MANKRYCFPLEKVLTVSARDYVESQGKTLSDYDMVGVHFTTDYDDFELEKFCEYVSEDAEAVVDYQTNITALSGEALVDLSSRAILSGTALIPKEKPQN
jgi:hypothetical protein